MKNVLLAVVGLSPQVITETLFALHQQGKTVHSIQVITTRPGKEEIYASLLSPRDGWYYQYLREYGIDPATIDFGFDNIHTVKDENGKEIEDIIGEQENEWLLKKCLDLTFRLTQDPDTVVFFSIAGGRKTMSACLMVAAQFYARPQDRLYHVLVSPEFESNKNFFFPPRKSVRVELKDQNGHPYFKETRFAQIILVPIPFVSVRAQISDDFLREPKDPATLMLSLVREKPAVLIVDLPNSKLIYKDFELDLKPSQLALYTFFTLQKKNCKKVINSCRGCTDCFLEISDIISRSQEIAELYQKVSDTRPIEEMAEGGIRSLDKYNFRSYRSKISRNLEKGFGHQALSELIIDSVGKKPNTRYGIRIDKERIRIIL